MKIEIDTKHDSPEEIRKVIKMLQHLVGESSYTNQSNVFDDSSPTTETGNAFASMFGDNSKPKTSSLAKKESQKIQIIPY